MIASAELERQRPDNMQLVFLVAARGKLRLAERDSRARSPTSGRSASSPDTNPGWVPWRSLAGARAPRAGRGGRSAGAASPMELEQRREAGERRCRSGWRCECSVWLEGGERGIELLEEAVETLGPTPARLEQARSLVELRGRAASGEQASGRPRAPSRRARAGAPLVAPPCSKRRRGTSSRRPAPARGGRFRPGVETLTASERRVAQMAAQELSNKEIAQTLFVTVKTVELHLSNVYRKLRDRLAPRARRGARRARGLPALLDELEVLRDRGEERRLREQGALDPERQLVQPLAVRDQVHLEPVVNPAPIGTTPS